MNHLKDYFFRQWKFSPSLGNVCLFITREYSFKLIHIEKKEKEKNKRKNAYFKKLRLEHPHAF